MAGERVDVVFAWPDTRPICQHPRAVDHAAISRLSTVCAIRSDSTSTNATARRCVVNRGQSTGLDCHQISDAVHLVSCRLIRWLDTQNGSGEPSLVEVDLDEGCVTVPLSKYRDYTTRICRPVGLTQSDRDAVVSFMMERIGLRYDMRNVLDLIRYLHPLPFVPVRWRRRMIALGSGEPTRAICSTLIAEAFRPYNIRSCR